MALAALTSPTSRLHALTTTGLQNRSITPSGCAHSARNSPKVRGSHRARPDAPSRSIAHIARATARFSPSESIRIAAKLRVKCAGAGSRPGRITSGAWGGFAHQTRSCHSIASSTPSRS
jgi:plasmid stabilization system protein ParE